LKRAIGFSFALFCFNEPKGETVMKRVSWIILLLIFTLVLAACGGDEPEVTVAEPTSQEEITAQEEPVQKAETAVEPEPVVVEEPTEEPEPTMEPVEEMVEAEVAFEELQLSQLDDLTSYRYNVVVDIMGTDAAGAEIVQGMEMELAVSADPPATSMKMISSGVDELTEMGEMEIVQIDGTSYMVIPELGCMPIPGGEGNIPGTEDFTQNLTPDAITENLEGVAFVGKENIDGIDVLHYTYDEAAMQGEDAADIESAEGHLYVAQDGGYLVRSIIDVVGKTSFVEGMGDEVFQTTTTHIEMNLTDINDEVEIVPPAACVEQTNAESPEWPMLDDASAVTSFAGILTYTAETSVTEAADFYNNAMTEMGYTLDEGASLTSDTLSLLVYTKTDEDPLTITIAEEPGSGKTTVTILNENDI
jgi:hypothetical protein